MGEKTIEIPLRWQGKELTLRLGGIDDDDITFSMEKKLAIVKVGMYSENTMFRQVW